MELEIKKLESTRAVYFAVTSVIVVVILVFFILAFTVFDPKTPVTTVNPTALKYFNFSIDIVRHRVYLNLTMFVNLSVKNPNKVGFKYRNSSALLTYKGEIVGVASIPAGKINAGEKRDMNVTLTVFGDRLVLNSNLYPDVKSGTLPLTTETIIVGKVRIMKLLVMHEVSYGTCDLVINVRNGSIGSQICHYRKY